MQRYELFTLSDCEPPQYLGGVGQYDVFYWTAGHDGNERLIVKWDSGAYAFCFWDFTSECWRNSYWDRKELQPEQTETILAMYQCFAIKPQQVENAEI
jgi:hypothetical protein